MSDFSDQVALVTGASRGIGQRIAERFSRAGAAVILADVAEAEVEKAAEELREAGATALGVPMDVSSQESIKQALTRISQDFEKIDILVNNAGITRDKLMLRMSEDDWNRVIEINLTGVFQVTRQVLPLMVRKRYGRIINVASVVGQMGNAGQANYVASKAGVIGFTKSVAQEVASRGITANAVAPGFIDTAMTASLSEETRQNLLSAVPLGRMGTVEDIAAGVLFLASREAGYITGHVLNINGGMYM